MGVAPSLRRSADHNYLVVGPGVESGAWRFDSPTTDEMATRILALDATDRFVVKTAPSGPLTGGTWTPVVTPDPDRQLHTISALPPVALYHQIGSAVSATVTYLIETTDTLGASAEWADYITLPVAPSPFPSPFAASGGATLALSGSDGNYRGGYAFTESGGVRLRPIYQFQSAGGTEVFVTVSFMYAVA